MKNLKLPTLSVLLGQAPVAPRIANVTLAHVLSGQAINVVVNHMSPLDKGKAISSEKNIRGATIRALEGEVHFEPPAQTLDEYAHRLERYICWHPDRAIRKVAMEQLQICDAVELASDIIEVRFTARAFSDACMALDLEQAKQLHRNGTWPSALGDLMSHIVSEMTTIHRAFHVQLVAARAWRLIHSPFDNVFGEANLRDKGYSAIGQCLNYLRMQRKDAFKTLALYKSGEKKFSANKFRFLDRYGLGALRDRRHHEAIIATFGPERVKRLKEELRELRLKDIQVRRILREIEPIGKDVQPPFVDFRSKRLDALHSPVSAVTVLAMRCANLAELLDGHDLPIDIAPAWISRKQILAEDEVDGFDRFLPIFLFYRGIFVEDKMPPEAEEVFGSPLTIEALEDLAITLKGKRYCRHIVDEMKRTVRRDKSAEAVHGLKPFERRFGSGSTWFARVRDLGARTYWREAA